MSNKSSDGRSGNEAIPSTQDKDASAKVGKADNSIQERDSDYEGQTRNGAVQIEDSRSEMSPTPVIPHGSKAVDVDKKK